MSEGETSGRGSSSSSLRPNSSRSGGRGRGRGRGAKGRGRGRGRGGRGRGGRGRSSNNGTAASDSTETTPNGEGPVVTVKNENRKEPNKNKNDHGEVSASSETHTDKRDNNNNNNDQDGRGSRGGRGGRSSGRGKSRGGGRGGRGRGRGRHNNDSRKNKKHKNNGSDDDNNHNKEVSQDNEAPMDFDNTAVLETGFPEAAGASAFDSMPSVQSNGGLDPVNNNNNLNHDSITKSLLTAPLDLPTPPSSSNNNFSGRDGVPIILSRNSHPPMQSSAVDYDSEAQKLSERLATAALEDFDIAEEKKEVTQTEEAAARNGEDATTNGNSNPTGKANKKPKKKKNKKDKAPPPPPVEEEPIDVSATDAIKAIPAQEVSITENTTVQIRRDDSPTMEDNIEEGPAKITGGGIIANTKGKSKKKKGLSKDHAANQKAAKIFNRAVRQCVERSDPDGMREILQDKKNHNFALDANVLETVMKAYVMAAMFEDALYCLRNCTLPGTLSTGQIERILTCLPQNLRNSSAYSAADMINALCIATEFDNPTSRTYFLRIVRGIALEFLEEVMSARDRICSAPCERLVRSAVCVVDARLKRGKKPADLFVVPGDQLGVFVPDSMENRGIQAGDAVSLLPYAGPYPMSAESLDRNMIEATVTNTNPMVLRLQDKTNTSLYSLLTENIDGNVYRIDKLANRMGFNRQLSAAVAIASPLGESGTRDTRRPCPQLMKAITAMDENINLVMSKSGGMFNGELTSTAALCAQAVPWSYEDEKQEEDGNDEDACRMASRLALDKFSALEGLNASQSLAVEGAVSNRLTLVQGPPGTGKTAVAIRILQHWARLADSNSEGGENPSPILATSDSNIAVDNLVEGCAAVGLRVVRLGRPEAIRPELLRFCVDRPPSSYSNGGKQQSGGNSAQAFKDRMKTLKKAQIICCTCIGSGGDILDAMTFDRVLVDEATQATEPAVLVPLMRGCRQLVLVGDHCQLPPTVLSTRAEEEGHGVPLFSRMVACGVPPFMLDTQYRMHPCIAMFPSDLFYGGKLLNGVTAPERRPLAGFPWPREEFPVAYLPVKGTEMDDGVSKLNEAEAAAACDAVAALLAGGQCRVSDIAVVTPYAAQARLIRRMTRRLTQNTGPPYIEVSSVDGFQGREKEAVVFSAVRSNDYGAIGFTSDWRRVNVSFTRARRALIVIGNDQTLRRGDPDTWMPWLAWADAHGLNMDKPGVPRGRYDPEQLRRVRGGTTAAEMLKDVLARQQAQLKSAEKQLEKAERNAKGHIIGKDDDDDDDGKSGSEKGLSLEEDLAMITNTDGNWDDSDEEVDMHRSMSQPTLTSMSSNGNVDGSDKGGAVDVWDL
ncbi:unnamed protein product [Cylindrotheca closterium]|uniref:AAA+ ATPase domain-containing protein n=1 Tax=Cylindrotheca closterium TaxID=2856 RepID=A0AAD2FZW6_9STRA|nr:unnamed protein product [Cylindrotheca closterium]